MFQLTAQSPGAAVRPINLSLGSHTLGRTPENQIPIPAPSVSSGHCELIVDENGILVRDLGSTNGTFVNEEQITERFVREGDAVRFGDESFVVERSGEEAPGVPPVPGKLGLALPVRPVVRPSPPASPAPSPTARRVSPQAAKPEVGGFWTELARAFVYPFRAGGWLKLLVAGILFGLLDLGSRFPLIFVSLFCAVTGTGYLFAYIQANITHSAEGSHEPAEWPGFTDWWEGVIRPCLLYLLVSVCAFAPLLVYLFFFSGEEPSPIMVFGLGALGLLYLPMALLATAMSDSFTGLNPLAVFPPIARLPLEYMATCALVFLLVLSQEMFAALMDFLPVPLIGVFPATFVKIYLVTVIARTLGILYHTRREKFGWFE